MRSLARTLAVALLVPVLSAQSPLPTPAGAPEPAGPPIALDGHWQCTGAPIPATERSYATPDPAKDRPRETFAIAEYMLGGAPVTAFEHITPRPNGSYAVESTEGNGETPPGSAFPLRFTGRSADGDATFELTYELQGAAMHRVARRGTTVVDDERCVREAPAPPATPCVQANVPASTVSVATPKYPPDVRADASVSVRVVLDDRSHVMWADVLTSTNPAFNDSARLTARDSTYRTELRDCRPRAAQFVFKIDYTK